jgi:hypothetical protein
MCYYCFVSTVLRRASSCLHAAILIVLCLHRTLNDASCVKRFNSLHYLFNFIIGIASAPTNWPLKSVVGHGNEGQLMRIKIDTGPRA